MCVYTHSNIIYDYIILYCQPGGLLVLLIVLPPELLARVLPQPTLVLLYLYMYTYTHIHIHMHNTCYT